MDDYEQEIRADTEGVLNEAQMRVVNELLDKIKGKPASNVIFVDGALLRDALDLIAQLSPA